MLEEPGLDLDVRHKGLSAEEWAILSGNPALATLIASEVSWRGHACHCVVASSLARPPLQ